MSRLIWTPAALADVERLHRFLNSRDREAVKRAVRAIRAGVRILAEQPRIGRAIDDDEPDFREWLIRFGASGYAVLYRLRREEVVLLAIRHQKEAGY